MVVVKPKMTAGYSIFYYNLLTGPTDSTFFPKIYFSNNSLSKRFPTGNQIISLLT